MELSHINNPICVPPKTKRMPNMEAWLFMALQIEGVQIFGPPPSNPGGRAALCTFRVHGVESEDITAIMDQARSMLG